jgi:predicted TIM-barrel fold metal-dependent hydrolase
MGAPVFSYPVRLRVTNAEYRDAWRALYGYEHEDMTDEHARDALRTKLRLVEQKGSGYMSWVLDQAGVEAMLVNASSPLDGQPAGRFRWVSYADGLLFPFPGERGGISPRDIDGMRGEIGLGASPPSLEAYVDEVVKAQMQEWKQGGALAIKFAIAYVRPIEFADVPVADASATYSRQARGEECSDAEDRALQDFLFRAVAREAGAAGLVVHIHTGIGADTYFNISGANPMLLESTFNDPTLRETKFVIIHGGWPFEHQAGVLIVKPNVYIDFSAQTFLRSTGAISEMLQEWIEFYPERVLFGSDCYSEDTPLANWEEKLWLTTRTARQALALALTRMMREGQITRRRAEELARMVLRENAAELYGLAAR